MPCKGCRPGTRESSGESQVGKRHQTRLFSLTVPHLGLVWETGIDPAGYWMVYARSIHRNR
jgi:hypothetical protein